MEKTFRSLSQFEEFYVSVLFALYAYDNNN
jgi:hypothetical protein